MKLAPTTREDLPLVQSWLDADTWHRDNLANRADYMLTGFGLLCYQVQDDRGTVFFIRLEQDSKNEDLIRVVAQFAPEAEVSKRRVIAGLIKAFLPASKKFAANKGYAGLIFESVNPSLISFMSKFGFQAVGGDDYAFRFEVAHV